jgi:hypothetical protein
VKANGGIISLGRVMHRLAISRAFGDFEFKYFRGDDGTLIRKNFLISEPEIRMI